MTKILINTCYGGYGISELAYRKLELKKGREIHPAELAWNTDWRKDTDLISIVEDLGDKANGDYAKIKIEEYDESLYVPRIREYDGLERLELVLKEETARELAVKDIDKLIELLKSVNAISPTSK